MISLIGNLINKTIDYNEVEIKQDKKSRWIRIIMKLVVKIKEKMF